MALQASGPISLADIAEEFGDSPPHSMSEFYRDGGKVPGVNTNVPTSGLIRLGNFFSAVNELLQQVTAQASVNAQTIFGSDWGAAVPKRLLIPSGVTIGPLTIPSGLGGTLTVQNEGEIQGLGGSANSGAGGHAITASSSFTLTNTGAVRGGGGGGGVGGTGGQGSYSYANYTSFYYSENPFWMWTEGVQGATYWNGTQIAYTLSAGQSPYYTGGYYYERGSFVREINWGDGDREYRYQIRRYNYLTAYSSGGTGGTGGSGQGYGQSLLGGSGGAGGGTNAGAGGTGGSGGNWGQAGATGGTGANGNYTGGSAGAAGGAAGRAVLMNAGTLTLNNSGTINGAY